MYPGTTQLNPYFHDAAPTEGEQGKQTPPVDEQKARQEQWMRTYGTYYQNPANRGPKLPAPVGRPSKAMFLIGAMGFLMAGLIFIFWGVLSIIMFPILTIMMFENGAISVIYINMILHILMAGCLVPILIGVMGFYKNYGSKFVFGPVIVGFFLILTLLITALFLGAAAEAGSQYALGVNNEYYYSQYESWDEYYDILHFSLSNLMMSTTIILMSIPLLMWKRTNRYPTLAQVSGIFGIISGALIILGLTELLGISFFFTGVSFIMCAASYKNFITLTEEDWLAYFTLKGRIDAANTEKDKLAMQLRYQMMYDPNLAFNPIYASMLSGGNPYHDLEKNIDKARSDNS